jgi:hypothetical protein
VPSGVLQPALGRQKRRRVRAKAATGAQSGISDGVSGVRTCVAMVRQGSEPSVADALESIEASGGCPADLLGFIEIVTFAISVAIGNLEPLPVKIRIAVPS